MIEGTENAIVKLENRLIKGLQQFDSYQDKKIEIKLILEEFQLQNLDWSKYQFWKEGVYTRNLIITNQQVTILLLCWDQDIQSPIHNHPCDGCFVVGLEGQLQETRYIQLEDQTLQQSEILQCQKGDISWMHDSVGYHKIAPIGGRAISLHVYYPPFDICTRYQMTGQSFKCQIKFNTIKGILNES